MRSVFSVSVKDVQLGNGGQPGASSRAAGRRAVTRVLRIALPAIGTALADLTHLVLPSDCRLCGSPVLSLGKVRVCLDCLDSVTPQQDTLCTRCGDALGMESARFAAALGTTECTLCRLAPPEFTRAVAFAHYDRQMRELLHLLKFEGHRRLAGHILAERMAAAVLKLRPAAGNDLLVVPVPLFAARERQRGFNQSTLLAEAAIGRLRKLAPGWKLTLNGRAMQRIKDTRPLYALNPAQRRRSLKGAFLVSDPASVRGREVLLIDDIMTTGATARECSSVLLRAGASKVWVATAAKAQPESFTAVFHSQSAVWTALPTARSVPLPAP